MTRETQMGNHPPTQPLDHVGEEPQAVRKTHYGPSSKQRVVESMTNIMELEFWTQYCDHPSYPDADRAEMRAGFMEKDAAKGDKSIKHHFHAIATIAYDKARDTQWLRTYTYIRKVLPETLQMHMSEILKAMPAGENGMTERRLETICTQAVDACINRIALAREEQEFKSPLPVR